MLWEILIAVSCGAAVDADSAGEAPEASQLSTRSFRLVSMDAKTHRIEVKEAGFEIVWQEKKTRFFHHHSVLLKDLPDRAAIQVFGKRHEEQRDDAKKAGKRSDPLVTDIELIGAGDAFTRPVIATKAQGQAWGQGQLVAKQPFWIEIEKRRFRLAGDDKLAAYSLAKLAPDKLPPQARIVITGTARKVTVERDGKPVELTRIEAAAVHWVELSAPHAKVFQAEWVERKKAPQGAAADAKGGGARQ